MNFPLSSRGDQIADLAAGGKRLNYAVVSSCSRTALNDLPHLSEAESDTAPIRIVLTKGELEIVAHQLSAAREIVEALDRRGFKLPSADIYSRIKYLRVLLASSKNHVLTVDASEMDREILSCVVEVNSWFKVHAGLSHQKHSGMFSSLQSFAAKVEGAFKLDRSLRAPIS